MSIFWRSEFLLAQLMAPAGDAAGDGGGGPASFLLLLPWIAIGVLFYMMLLRPERKKRADLQQMHGSLKKNDRVVTVGGIVGTVLQASPEAEEVTLRVDENNNTRIRVLRTSISRVISADGAAGTKEIEAKR